MQLRILFTAIVATMFTNIAAQSPLDAEMQRLISIVVSLRQTEQGQQRAAWEKAGQAFEGDKAWTLMDETTAHSNECSLTDRSIHRFALNRMLKKYAHYDDIKARGEFNNGENPNFNYSLIERSIQKGKKTTSYALKGREGQQFFVIVPFDTSVKLDVEIKRDGETISTDAQTTTDYVLVEIPASEHVRASDELTLEVRNKASRATAFVIINHNTRSQ